MKPHDQNQSLTNNSKNKIDLKESVFGYCDSLEEISLPNGIDEIPQGMFECCSHLRKIDLPEELKSIGLNAFRKCYDLEEVSIPEDVDYIGDAAFEECKKITSIKIPDGVKEIRGSVFEGCNNLEEIQLPQTLKVVRYKAFYGCSKLKNIDLPESLIFIDSLAFAECKSLKEFTIPSNCTGIHGGMLLNCSGITEITLPNVLDSYSGDAFYGCCNLERFNLVDIKANCDEVDLESVYQLSIEDEVLIGEINGYKIIERCPSKKCFGGSYRIADDVDYVEYGAFHGCTDIRKLILPKKNLVMGDESFDYTNISIDEKNGEIILTNDEKRRGSKIIPFPYLTHLIENGKLGEFLDNADYRAFNSNFPDLLNLLSSYSTEEKIDFFKFAVNLGCFSKKKYLDNNLKETEFTIGQKATAALVKLMKTPELKLGKYHGLFDSASFEINPSQEFLDFITPQGKKHDNVELLCRLNSQYQGMFAKVMSGFNDAKQLRTSIGDDGMTAVIPWEEVFIKYYKSVKYVGVNDENKDIAKTYASKGVTQYVFDRGTQLRNEAKAAGVPEHILGKALKEKSVIEQIEELKASTEAALFDSQELIDDLHSKLFTFEWLSKNDPRNGILGLYVSCCGTLSSQFYGRFIAESTITKHEVQNLVINNPRGEIISKGTIYINKECGYGVINDFELNDRYRAQEIESDGRYYPEEKDERTLTENEKKQVNDRQLIFEAYLRGVDAFVAEYNLQHPDKPLNQINVGMGYNRLKKQTEALERATENLTVPASYHFEDAAREQHIIYPRKDRLYDNCTRASYVEKKKDDIDER